MKLYQLAFDEKTYGDQSGWWIVTSDDFEDELAGPFKERDDAANWIKANEKRD